MKIPIHFIKLAREFAKYNLVGAARSIFTFSIYAILVNAQIHPSIALALVFCVAAPVTIFLHRKYVFPHDLSILTVLPRYLLLYGSMFLLNSVMLFVLVEGFQLGGIWSQLICITIITLINYLFLAKYLKALPNSKLKGRNHREY